MAEPIRVYILDDHEEVRQALAARLSAMPDMLIVGSATGSEPALAQLRCARPDVVLVETKRGDGRGLELVHWIAQSAPGARVIVLTSYPSEWERWAAYRAGATGYFLKDINSSQLVEQIRGLQSAAA